MLNIFIFLLGLAGAGLMVYGAWLVFPPSGFIICGLLLIWLSYMFATVVAKTKQHNRTGD